MTAALRLYSFLFTIFVTAVSLSTAKAQIQYSGSQTMPQIETLLPLIPAGSRVTEVLPSTKMSFKLDELTSRILHTKTGRSFCGAVVEDFKIFRSAFFINTHRLAQDAFQNCKGAFARSQNHRLFPKRYFLVQIPHEDYQVTGWTTHRNETFIFVSTAEFSDQRLFQTLTHELAISLDKKETMGFGGMIDSAGLNLVSDDNACNAVAASRESVMKHSLSALRAFDIERKVGEEAGFVFSPDFANWENVSCEDKIEFMAEYISGYEKTLAYDAFLSLTMEQPFCSTDISPSMSLKARAQVLAQTTLTFKSGEQINACEFLTRGIPFIPGVGFRGGPGPRIGGGGWDKLKKTQTSPKQLNPTLKQENKIEYVNPETILIERFKRESLFKNNSSPRN